MVKLSERNIETIHPIPLNPALSEIDLKHLRAALRLARRGAGTTSPNPMVGAVLVKNGRVIGRGWHRRAGEPHAEIEALRDAARLSESPRGATLYVTLEPCCTHGRTPPCTDAILAAGIKTVVIGTQDPNPQHAGQGFEILRAAGVKVKRFVSDATPENQSKLMRQSERLAQDCTRLNVVFNHWIVHRTPLVTVKAAMTLDGRIATANGESKWITGPAARAEGMKLRREHDAILVGVNTILADDPSLTVRPEPGRPTPTTKHLLRRIVLDSQARTPLTAKVVSDADAALTTIIVSRRAPARRVAALAKRVRVLVAPLAKTRMKTRMTSEPARIDLPWLLKTLGRDNVTSLLVEGGGEVNASFLLGGLAQRVAFFYAPKILGGREAHRAVAGPGAEKLSDVLNLHETTWRRLGEDLMLTAQVTAR